MTHIPNLLTSLLTAGAVLAAGSTAARADASRRIPVLEQRAAILDCRYEMGLRGTARFGAQWREIPPGGPTVTWIVPGPGLSPSQADRVNQCADERLGRAKTPRFAAHAEPRRTEYRRCPPGAPVILGGAAYCLRRN